MVPLCVVEVEILSMKCVRDCLTLVSRREMAYPKTRSRRDGLLCCSWHFVAASPELLFGVPNPQIDLSTFSIFHKVST